MTIPMGDLSQQIATRDRCIQSIPDLGMMLPNPDPVLKALGKDIEVYRNMRVSPQIGGNIRRRRSAVKSLEWDVRPGGASARATRSVKSMIKDLDMNGLLSEIMNAPMYGYQPLEIEWEYVGSYYTPTSVIGKLPEWFHFDGQNQPRFRTKDNPLYGELLPDRKFIFARQDATYDNPYGFPDLSMCFWADTFIKGGLKFWVTFSEKYGIPWVIGKHPRNTPESETEQLLDRLSDMVQDAVAVIPDDSSVDIKEATGKAASADVFERLLVYCRGDINYALLGQNQSSEATSNRASSQVGHEVTKSIRNADKRIVESVFNGLVRFIFDYNFNDNNRPEFYMFDPNDVDESMATRDQSLYNSGVRFTSQYFKRAYGFQDGDLVEAATPSSSVQFAEASNEFPDQAALDAAVTSLDAGLQDHGQSVLAPLVQLINNSADYAEALGKLAALFPKLDTASLEDALTRAMFVAELWGHVNGDNY